MEDMIYLDNAATTRLDEKVLEAMLPFMTSQFGNPSSSYAHGRRSRLAIEQARKMVADLLHAKSNEIFFTSGGTESNNAAIMSAVRDLHCHHIITSAIEHPAVLNTIEHCTKSGMAGYSYVKLQPGGQVDLDDLEKQLKAHKERCLVSLMHANNEIGNLLNIEAVGELCQKYRAIFHSDCVQTVGHYPLSLHRSGLHFITASAHKFHGPKGTGLLYINKEISVKPFIFGGGQEHNMRAGTENLYGIVGFAKALSLAMENFEKDSGYIQSLKTYMTERLRDAIPGIQFNGSGKCLYAVLSVSFPASKVTEMLLVYLDRRNICVSGGSACSSSKGGSHVIREIGEDMGKTTVRFSFSKHNTVQEIDKVIVNLEELLIVNT